MLKISLVGYGVGGYGIEDMIGYARLMGWIGIAFIVLEALVHLGTSSMRRYEMLFKGKVLLFERPKNGRNIKQNQSIERKKLERGKLLT